jgi:hypothetical protein
VRVASNTRAYAVLIPADIRLPQNRWPHLTPDDD